MAACIAHHAELGGFLIGGSEIRSGARAGVRLLGTGGRHLQRHAVPIQGDLSGKEAVETAILWRNGRDIAIVVIDDEGLWLPEWGDLEA